LTELTSGKTIEEFCNTLRSKNAENLYLTYLLKFYFSKHENTGAQIGLWCHPPFYDENGNFVGYEYGNFTEKKVHNTFLISDRYNWFLRNHYHIDGVVPKDSYGGNPTRVGETTPLEQQVNEGGTIFYFDEDKWSTAGAWTARKTCMFR
jgi:hypothetical protein